jgi:hypothetical protein
VVATVVWELRRGSRARLARTAFAALALVALFPLPYFVRNCVWFHNPIAFFGNSIFRNPYFHVSFEKEFVRSQAHLNGVTWSDLPLNLTVGGSKLPESLGAIYLLAPIALLCGGRRAASWFSPRWSSVALTRRTRAPVF